LILTVIIAGSSAAISLKLIDTFLSRNLSQFSRDYRPSVDDTVVAIRPATGDSKTDSRNASDPNLANGLSSFAYSP